MRRRLRPGIPRDGGIWDPQVKTADNWRFTERNEHYGYLYEQAQRAQFSPKQLREAKTSELIFIAAHDEPVPIDDERYGGEGHERRNKLRQNALRANAELTRRSGNRQSWLNGLVGLIVGAALALLGSYVLHDDSSPTKLAPTATTTTHAPTTTITAPGASP